MGFHNTQAIGALVIITAVDTDKASGKAYKLWRNPLLGRLTCFRCKQSCRQASAGSSHRCRWARQSERTRVSTAGCHCRQWICPPCWAPGPGWSLSDSGSSPPAGGSCADGYCGGHSPTAHSYKNTHQRQETNIKSYLVPLVVHQREHAPPRLTYLQKKKKKRKKVKESFLPVFKDECCDQGCDNHNERHSDCDYLVNCQTCGGQKKKDRKQTKEKRLQLFAEEMFGVFFFFCFFSFPTPAVHSGCFSRTVQTRCTLLRTAHFQKQRMTTWNNFAPR